MRSLYRAGWSLLCFIVQLAVAASSTAGGSAIKCATLLTLLPGRVYYPGSTTFLSSIASYWFVEARLNPTCIVTPTTALDVAITVKNLGLLQQKHSGSKFAIRGGGHSPNVAAANVHQGVTIDLRALKSIRVNKAGDITSVGAGAIWSDVYAELVSRNLSVVGGRVTGPGLGGLITGGGISYFSPEKGFASENIVNMEVVLSSGAIVNANLTSNSDLFQALKGGSNNFGIVTRFDLKSFTQGNFWGGAILYPQSSDSEQLAAIAKFKEVDRFDPYAEIESSFLYLSASRRFQSANNMFYTRPVVNPPSLQPFTKIQPQLVNTMRISSISDFAAELAHFQPVNQLGIYATNVFEGTPSMIKKVHALWNASVPSVANVANLTYALVFQSVPRVSQGNIFGLDHSSEPEKSLILCLLSNFWAFDADTKNVLMATKKLLADIEKAAKDEGMFNKFQYLNYAAEWQDPFASYGEKQVKKLRDVSKKYDPAGLFQKGVSGKFKLF